MRGLPVLLALVAVAASQRYSDQDIKVVKPPKFDDVWSRHRSLSGFTKLQPVSSGKGPRRPMAQERNISGKRFGPGGWHAQERIMPGHRDRQERIMPEYRDTQRPRPTQESFGAKFARWFFSPDDSSEAVGTAPKPSVVRPPSNFPSRYEKYPPFWQDDSGGYSRVNGPPPPRHASHAKHYKHTKKDCNPCNSVPWVPIAKSAHSIPLSPVHPDSSVPYGDHHDATGYSSSQQFAVLPPAPVVEISHNLPDSTVSNSYGLPAGNVPTGHGLLAPVNHLAEIPSSYGAPAFLGQPIPFPQLSHVAIAPLHNSIPFVPETPDLVPPLAPQKTVSNVVFTISEQHEQQLQQQQQPQPHQQPQNVELVSHNSIAPDQSSQSSSLVDSHTPPRQQELGRQQHKYHQSSGVDIVKSVPLAEYTSSIEYPLHFVQSHPYIDITAQAPSNTSASAVGTQTYEKQSQTGPQKISDIILNVVRDGGVEVNDSAASGSIVSEHASKEPGKVSELSHAAPEKSTTVHYSTTTPAVPSQGQGAVGSPFYVDLQSGSPGFTYQQPAMQPFQNSFHQENGQLVMDAFGPLAGSAAPPVQTAQRDYLSPDILTPPPVPPSMAHLLPHYNGLLNGSPAPYLNPPGHHLRPTKETPLQQLGYPSTTSWLLPAQTDAPSSAQFLLPATTSAVPYPFNADPQQGIATVINGGLLPPPPPQPMNSQHRPKKIQIIIPYTTINSKDFDQNALATVQRGLYQALLNDSAVRLPESERAHTWMPIVVTEQPMIQNQGRKKPDQNYQNFDKFKDSNWNDAQHSESRPVKSEMQHILATNIRELLSDEMEKPKSDQNIRLQKNIDNWTAQEYSNHKVVAKKKPVDVITHAHAVTSIPGTSISHLLLPSKKIPPTYLTSTATPAYDEPRTTPFATSSVSVNSKPFTYTTASMYSTVAKNGVFTTTPKPTTKKNVFKVGLDKLEQIRQQSIRNSQLSSFATQENHRNGYQDVSKLKKDSWGKLKGNLVGLEDAKKSTDDIEFAESSTARSTWADYKVSISPGTNEKVYVVTPVSTSKREEYKRTTREVTSTEATVSDSKASETSRYFKNTKPFNSYSYTKLEKLKNATFGKNESTPLYQLKTNKTDLYRPKVSKFNKPKPIEKFFATTKTPPKNESKSEPKVKQEQQEQDLSSINDVFPFRNGGELPVEMSQANLDAQLLAFRNTGERKTLIKQVKTKRKDQQQQQQQGDYTTPEYTDWTTEEVPQTTLVVDLEDDAEKLQVDVVLPEIKNDTKTEPKESIKKKPSSTEKKKVEKVNKKTSVEKGKAGEHLSKFNPEEPNITDDDREKINSLSDEKEKETLLAVESKLPRGVFGETSKVDTLSFKPEAIQETIRLLTEFLAESGKAPHKTESKFTEHDKLLTGLESLTPVLSKAPLESSSSNKNDEENLKSLENKLLKKLDKKPKDNKYMFNFPEYLVSDLNLTKDELSLIEGAMVELRKSRLHKKLEGKS